MEFSLIGEFNLLLILFEEEGLGLGKRSGGGGNSFLIKLI